MGVTILDALFDPSDSKRSAPPDELQVEGATGAGAGSDGEHRVRS